MSTSSTNRNVILILLAFSGICLCLCVLFVGGVYTLRNEVVKVFPALEPVLLSSQQNTPTQTTGLRPTRKPVPTRTQPPTEPVEPPAPTEAQAIEPTMPPEPTGEEPASTDAPASTLPADVARSMDEIQEQVIDLRGLQPSGTFTRDVLTPDQLRENVMNDFFEETTPEDTRNEVLELSLLALLEPGFDLDSFYADLLSEQVAGYYDDETQEMYVVGEQFGGVERLTYSHEYVHALQDQNYDFKNGLKFDDESCELDSERCAGVQALIEGDATLVEMQWLTQYFTQEDYVDYLEFYNNFESPVYDSAPEYMKEDFLFPYTSGQQFVQHLFDQGGWDAVDAAYIDVPVSTEQILHPERYPDDRPVKVDLVDFTTALGNGWEEIDRDVMGEWWTYLVLAKGLDSAYRLDEDTASQAAEGWGGDAYAAYYHDNTGEALIVISYVWDTQTDADEFASALLDYGRQRFGRPDSKSDDQTEWEYSGGYSIFRQVDQATWWVIAPSQVMAETVADELTP